MTLKTFTGTGLLQFCVESFHHFCSTFIAFLLQLLRRKSLVGIRLEFYLSNLFFLNKELIDSTPKNEGNMLELWYWLVIQRCQFFYLEFNILHYFNFSCLTLTRKNFTGLNAGFYF